MVHWYVQGINDRRRANVRQYPRDRVEGCSWCGELLIKRHLKIINQSRSLTWEEFELATTNCRSSTFILRFGEKTVCFMLSYFFGTHCSAKYVRGHFEISYPYRFCCRSWAIVKRFKRASIISIGPCETQLLLSALSLRGGLSWAPVLSFSPSTRGDSIRDMKMSLYPP